ncbi:MAG: GTP-binding protein [Comamonadaceae bacterium]|nr:GTP-binding protein [Comamonadaceae bacterium]
MDLGFAHWEAPGLSVAFVDVPGHERFVKNMLAGVGGIDAVMLVVAADESVMPQTREHFEICRLLHVPAGLVVADEDRRGRARDDRPGPRGRARSLSPARSWTTRPCSPVSSRTGEGLDALRVGAAPASGPPPSAQAGGRPRQAAGRSRVLDARVRHRGDRHARRRPPRRRDARRSCCPATGP